MLSLTDRLRRLAATLVLTLTLAQAHPARIPTLTTLTRLLLPDLIRRHAASEATRDEIRDRDRGRGLPRGRVDLIARTTRRLPAEVRVRFVGERGPRAAVHQGGGIDGRTRTIDCVKR